MLRKLDALVRPRPVRVVPDEASREARFDQGVESLDIVTMTRDLHHEGDEPFGREDQVLPDTAKPAFERGTVPFSGQTAQALFLPGAYGSADVYRMGIDEKKGERPSLP